MAYSVLPRIFGISSLGLLWNFSARKIKGSCSKTLCTEDCDEKTCSNIKSLKAPGNLKDLIDGLYLYCSHNSVDVEKVKQFMGSYKSNKEEWKKYVNFDPHRYTRNLVDKGNGKFNLILLCWGESQGSVIHSHGGSHCFMKILDGEVKETQYEWPTESSGDQEMTKLREAIHKKEEVAYMCDEIGLHSMENPSHTEPAVTLHLYSPPYQESNIFDEKTGRKGTATMTFYSEFGKRV